MCGRLADKSSDNYYNGDPACTAWIVPVIVLGTHGGWTGQNGIAGFYPELVPLLMRAGSDELCAPWLIRQGGYPYVVLYFFTNSLNPSNLRVSAL